MFESKLPGMGETIAIVDDPQLQWGLWKTSEMGDNLIHVACDRPFRTNF